jgi:hypothetical protein
MDKTLVVVYSYSGTSRRLAQVLCSQHGWPMGEISEAMPRSGTSGTLRCVLDSLLRRRPAVRYQGPAPGDFESVVLVAPIWVYRLAGPMRSFVAGHREELRHVAVISVMSAKGAANAAAETADLLGRAPFLTTAFITREVDDGTCTPRLQVFGDAVKGYAAGGEPIRLSEWSPRAA